MYIIFSNKKDSQTNEVIDRLRYYGKNTIRVNQEIEEFQVKIIRDKFKTISIQANTQNDTTNNQVSIYFRRPSSKIIDQLIEYNFLEVDVEYPVFQQGSNYFRVLKNNYFEHQKKFYEIILNNPKYCICKIEYRLNKLDVLFKAMSVGLEIPETLISGDKKEIKEFYTKNNGELITKSLYEIIPRIPGNENFWIKSYTQKLENINEMPESFFPTLFQKNIEKKYEVRVFYILGECYSAAIMSQQNEKTKVDLRNSDKNAKNRIVPYKLTPELKSKVLKLMTVLNLNTGSLDFMIGTNGTAYFLEVNPVGQYGWINAACNFGISDDIAKKMIEMHDS